MSPKPPTGPESLVQLARQDDINATTLLLRILTELYVEKPAHSAEEQHQLIELMLRLFGAFNPDVRREVAAQLAGYTSPPCVAAHRPQSDAVNGAEPVLKDRLHPEEIVDIVPAPARDKPLTNLDQEGAHPWVASATELNELFFAADSSERRMIVMNLDYGGGNQSRPSPDDSALDRLEAAALQGRSDEFVRELGRTLQISHAHAQRIVQDPSGEPLVVAAKVLAAPTDVLQRILLCANPSIGHSVRRIHHLTALHRDMSMASARQLLAIWQQSAPRAPRIANDQASPMSRRVLSAIERSRTGANSRGALFETRGYDVSARYRQGNGVQHDPRFQRSKCPDQTALHD